MKPNAQKKTHIYSEIILGNSIIDRQIRENSGKISVSLANRPGLITFLDQIKAKFLLRFNMTPHMSDRFFYLCATAEEHGRTEYPYKECFESAGRLYKISPRFLASVASVESSLNPRAVSGSDAVGLMQIQWPATEPDTALGFKLLSTLATDAKNLGLILYNLPALSKHSL
jgi:hypothetical protein